MRIFRSLDSSESSPRLAVWVYALPAICVALVVLLPFLRMAFTIDDVTFLLQAKHLLIDPRHPTAFNMVADSERIRLSQQLVSGPVMAYLLVPTVLAGGAEWIAHSIQLVLLVGSLVATASLAVRMGLDRVTAGIAAALVTGSPAVLGMATTAMPDVAAMAFAVIGVERMFASIEHDDVVAAVVSGLFLALAALSRPHVLLVFPCAAGLALAFMQQTRGSIGKQRFAKVALPLVVGLAVWGLGVLITRDPSSGETVAVATLQRMNRKSLWFNIAAFAINWVVAFPLGLLWPILRGDRYFNRVRSAAAFTIGMTLISATLYADLPWWLLIPAMALAGLGVDILFDIVGDAFERGDWVQLGLLSWMCIAFPAVLYMHLPAKDLVPSAPPMALLLARNLRYSEVSSRYRSVAITAIAGVVLGVLIIRADARLAEVGRIGGRIAGELVRSGNTVWVDGGWGHQWYGMERGAETLATTAPFPRAGDMIVLGLSGHLVENYPDKDLLYRRIFDGPGGWVQGEGAGFFSNYGGPLPWVWSEKEYGRIEVWRLRSDRRIQ